ncbi:MAG: glycosyltransferase family 4 protein [Patescibacteria group bacterium]
MTIVMIGQKGLPARSGGIERHVQDLAEGLVARGHRVIVFARQWYVGDREAPKGIEQVFSRGIHTKHLDAVTYSLTALWSARRLHPDIVHIHGVGIGLLTPLARLLFWRAKIVVTFHCLDRVFSKWGWFARLAFRIGEVCSVFFAHQTITVSQELLRYCLQTYGCRTTYISHAFQASPMKENPATVERLGLVPGAYLLFVGRLLKHKGAHLLIEAYRRAKIRRPDLFENVSLAIVGAGAWTDAYTKELTAQSATVPGVHMLGEVCGGDVAQLRAQCLVNVFPTWEEGLSVAVLEAAVSGRPVVASDIAPNREALGGYAMDVKTKDIEDLCRGLCAVLSLSDQARTELAEQARAFVLRQFDARRNTDEVARLYQELVVSNVPAPVVEPAV